MREFKVGDRVKVIQKEFVSYGLTGTITHIEDRENGEITINFDDGRPGLLFANEIIKIGE